MSNNTHVMHQKRIISLDLIRDLALILMIGIHSYSAIANIGYFHHTPSLPSFSDAFFANIFFICNPLFFMLSGYLNLKAKQTSPIIYIKKKAWTIIFPLIFSELIFYIYQVFSTSEKFSLSHFVHNILFYYDGQHFWFVYTLLAFLLISPFLAKMLDSLSDKEYIVLFLISFIMQLFRFFVKSAQLPFSFSAFPITDWFLYFLVGNLIRRLQPQLVRYRLVFLIIGLVSLTGNILVELFSVHYRISLHDLSPLYYIASISIFVYLLTILHVSEKLKPVLFYLSKQSYFIFLIHSLFIHPATRIIKAVSIQNSILALALTILIVLALSLIVSIVFNLALMDPLKKRFLTPHTSIK